MSLGESGEYQVYGWKSVYIQSWFSWGNYQWLFISFSTRFHCVPIGIEAIGFRIILIFDSINYCEIQAMINYTRWNGLLGKQTLLGTQRIKDRAHQKQHHKIEKSEEHIKG